MRGMQDIVMTLASFCQTYLSDVDAQFFLVNRATNLLETLKRNVTGQEEWITRRPKTKYYRRVRDDGLYRWLIKY